MPFSKVVGGMVDSERFGELGCEMFGERLQPVRVEGTRFVEEPFPFVDAPCLRELAAGGELAGGPGRRSDESTTPEKATVATRSSKLFS